MANVTNLANQYYSTASPNGLPLAGSQFLNGYVNPNFIDSYVKLGMLRPLSAPANTSQAASTTGQRQPFTPNAYTEAQLSGLNSTPQWMMDAYTKKIGQMGGNANPAIPFAVTQSGFPGVGGKTAPANSTGTGG
jgi:hypothetical protein